ncbi:MAG TPA: nuclear transport factor 2 family protein [Gemmatimonadales bacterium]|nr:nuclear transport factor 2 family protein [Gemmatimonadales bacterium]
MARSALLIALTLGMACRPAAPDRKAAEAAIMQADRDFASAVARTGIDAWVAAFAVDGVQITQRGVIQGSDAIRKLMAADLADTVNLLDWQPVSAEVGSSADLGYTIGRWQLRVRAKPDSVLAHGNYLTVWRKGPDGTWKAAVDIGNPQKS